MSCHVLSIHYFKWLCFIIIEKTHFQFVTVLLFKMIYFNLFMMIGYILRHVMFDEWLMFKIRLLLIFANKYNRVCTHC